MRIGLDLTATAAGQRGGPSLYALALTRALLEQAPHDEYLACFRLSALKRRALLPRLRIAARFYWDRLDPLLARGLHLFHGLISRAGSFGDVRQVVTLHDVVHAWTPAWSTPHGRARRLAHYRKIRERADAVIAVSEWERRRIIEQLGLHPDRVRVIPLAPAPEFVPGAPPSPETLARLGVRAPYLLFVGAIQARKNVAALLRAFATLRTDAQLVLAGPVHPSYRAELEAALAPIAGRTKLLGYVDNLDLPRLYAGALCFVLPSLYESFGIPAVEAMACGCPVVASSAGALPEVVAGAAEMCEASSVESIASALQRVLDDAGLRARLREAGLRRAAQFSYARVARETSALYHALI